MHGEEINTIGQRWCSFYFENAPLDKLDEVQVCTSGIAYLIRKAFNASRASDHTTVPVSAWDKAIGQF